MNYPAASGRNINPKKQKQNTTQAAGELTQKRLNDHQDLSIVDSNKIDLKDRDELFDEDARIDVINQSGLTSPIQREFSIVYNKVGRIMDQLEAAGIVGENKGSSSRQVLIHDIRALEQLLKGLNQY